MSCYVSFRDTVLEGEQRIICRIAELNSLIVDRREQEMRNENMWRVRVLHRCCCVRDCLLLWQVARFSGADECSRGQLLSVSFPSHILNKLAPRSKAAAAALLEEVRGAPAVSLLLSLIVSHSPLSRSHGHR